MTLSTSMATATAAPPMAFVSADTQALVALVDGLRTVIGDVTMLGALDDVWTLPPSSLVAVHYDTRRWSERVRLAAGFPAGAQPPTLLLLSERRDLLDFCELFGSHVLTNIVVLTGDPVSNRDLLVTIDKLRFGDIFGLEKYFAPGVPTRTRKLRASSERHEVMREVADLLGEHGVAGRLRRAILNVADEFLTNVLYDAPTLSDGRPRFSHVPRTEGIVLDVEEHVGLSFCHDGQRFGLAACDPFGSLDPRRLQDYLARGFRGGTSQVREGTGGAGLGFFSALDSLSHLVINLAPGRRTEMIGLVDVSGGYRHFLNAGKSFNIFVEQDRP